MSKYVNLTFCFALKKLQAQHLNRAIPPGRKDTHYCYSLHEGRVTHCILTQSALMITVYPSGK